MEIPPHDESEKLSDISEDKKTSDSEPNDLATKSEDTGNSESISPEIQQYLIDKKPDRIAQSISINPSAMETLAHSAPDTLIQLANDSDERQYKYHSTIAKYRYEERVRRENTIRWIGAGIVGIIMMAFIYAGITKDSALANDLIKTLMVGGGGVGIGSSSLLKKKDDN
jgi:hypothetical protein